MEKWEYIKQWDVTKEQLNTAGQNGWELVSVIYDQTNSLLYLFKKKIVI